MDASPDGELESVLVALRKAWNSGQRRGTLRGISIQDSEEVKLLLKKDGIAVDFEQLVSPIHYVLRAENTDGEELIWIDDLWKA
jgi:hypothetical protein